MNKGILHFLIGLPLKHFKLIEVILLLAIILDLAHKIIMILLLIIVNFNYSMYSTNFDLILNHFLYKSCYIHPS